MAWTNVRQAAVKLPKLLLKGEINYDFDGIPIFPMKLSWKKRINLFKNGWNSLFRKSRLYGLPPIIQVEPTNICNLRCPLCPTGSGFLKRSKTKLPLAEFRRLLDELEDVLISVYLFCFGEPFMHENILEMIGECTKRGIATLTSTNGHFLQTCEEAEKLVASGLRTLIVALDGSTQDVFQVYRRNGNLEKVKRFIGLVNEAKTKKGSPFPYIAARAVVTRDNEADLSNMENLSRELGANMFTYKSVGCMTHDKNFQNFEPSRREVRRFEYAGGARIRQKLICCPFPFRQPIVFCDGNVVGCEYDHDMEKNFGNIKQESFKKIWNSSQARQLRRSIIQKKDRPLFCTHCPYQDNVRKGTELWCLEIKAVGRYQ
ncbi:MAG: SPASM domain-containing protein [Candidatus Aminicenantes bacterium]|nr:SPASM domain-containing protein [Candidatus Aminicenantes bacterium]